MRILSDSSVFSMQLLEAHRESLYELICLGNELFSRLTMSFFTDNYVSNEKDKGKFFSAPEMLYYLSKAFLECKELVERWEKVAKPLCQAIAESQR